MEGNGVRRIISKSPRSLGKETHKKPGVEGNFDGGSSP